MDPAKDYLEVAPAKLLRWLKEPECKNTLVWLDFDPTVHSTGEISFRIQVTFNPIAFHFRHGRVRSETCHVGSEAGQVVMSLTDGSIKSHTGKEKIRTKSNVSATAKDTLTVALKPKVKGKLSEAEIEAELGEARVEFERGNEAGTEYEHYECTVDFLGGAPGKMIIWNVTAPKGLKVVREFLFGNYIFDLKGKWPGIVSGSIAAAPGNIRYYNNQNKQMNPI